VRLCIGASLSGFSGSNIRRRVGPIGTNDPVASEACHGLAFPRQNSGSISRLSLTTSNGIGACKPPERTCNADLQNRPSAKPVTPIPSHRSTGDLQSATILECLPNQTRRCKPSRPTTCHPRAQVSFHVKHFGTIDIWGKHTCARRREVESRDLDLARCSARV
jgi:hypothetical protein